MRSLSKCLLAFAIFTSNLAFAQSAPPKTPVHVVTDDYFGTKVADPYRWLEDQNSPETRAWIKAQQDYTKSMLSQMPGRDELKSLIGKWMRVGEISAPLVREDRFFYVRRTPGQEQAAIYVRQGWDGKETVLVDPNTADPASPYAVTIESVSADGRLLAYEAHPSGADQGLVHFLDTRSGKELSDGLPSGRYWGIELTPDDNGYYYGVFDSASERVCYHRFGVGHDSDIEVFGKQMARGQWVFTTLSEDGHYLLFSVLSAGGKSNTDIYIQNLQDKGPVVPLAKGLGANLSAAFAGSHLYLATDWKAPHGRVLEVDLNNAAMENWREVVPESTSFMNLGLDSDFAAIGGKLFVVYHTGDTERVKVFDASGKYIEDLPFPTLGSLSNTGILRGTWKGEDAYYSFTSYAIPARIYRYNTRTRKQSEWAHVDGPINPDELEIKQVFYESKDKTKVPMMLVYKKGIRLNGRQPVLLSGYGGFGVGEYPMYELAIMPAAFWASRGGVFAWAGLRGGDEYGEAWHRAGMLGQKQNVFDDFIAASEWLINNKYTDPAHLAIMGDSNGGLLMGAALTQRPDLYKAVVCAYPLLDMLRYQKFLMGYTWVGEFGSAANPDQFRYLIKYSPYQNVRSGAKYPAVLFVSGDSDTRVAPLHARKMTALLQASTGSKNPVLLRYNTSAGHSGMFLPASQQIDELADEFGFLFWQLGMNVQPKQEAAASTH